MSTDFSAQFSADGVHTTPFAQMVNVANKWVRISSATTTQVKTGRGFLAGIILASGSSPTVVIYDDTASTLVALNTMTPVVGWNPIPLPFTSGLRIVTGGTIDCTVVFA